MHTYRISVFSSSLNM